MAVAGVVLFLVPIFPSEVPRGFEWLPVRCYRKQYMYAVHKSVTRVVLTFTTLKNVVHNTVTVDLVAFKLYLDRGNFNMQRGVSRLGFEIVEPSVLVFLHVLTLARIIIFRDLHCFFSHNNEHR